MKRLTTRDEYDNADIVGVDSAELQLNLPFDQLNLVTDALNRLAAYEDTGLMPNEITKLALAVDRGDELQAENARLKRVAEAARLLLKFTDSPNGLVGFVPCQSLDRLQQALAELEVAE